jgi:hypothetical protein
MSSSNRGYTNKRMMRGIMKNAGEMSSSDTVIHIPNFIDWFKHLKLIREGYTDIHTTW